MLRVWFQIFCLAWLPMAGPLAAAPKVLVLGDSMSEEYAFELPFSAPENDPLDANTSNWIEILNEQRLGLISFGSYDSDPLAYLDLRNGGFSYNWGVPGADSDMWQDVVTSTLFHQPGFLSSRIKLEDHVTEVDVIVIFIGGNDVRSDYGNLYNDTPAPNWITDIIENLEEVFDFIRAESATVPVILCTAPDVGATPDRQAAYPSPAQRQTASAHIAQLNLAISQLATSEGAYLADIAAITAEVIEPAPFYIGATEMFKDGHPNNEPLYLFCRDGFHPATSAQAIIGNAILEQINLATSSTVPLLSNRDIVGTVLKLNPDQAYFDWVDSFLLTSSDMQADPDGDGLPNIGEYLFGTHPNSPNSPYTLGTTTLSNQLHFSLAYTVSEEGGRLAHVVTLQSNNMTDWAPVSESSVQDLGGGDFEVLLPATTKLFFKQDIYLTE